MEKQIEEKNTEMGSVITRSEEFIQKNQKNIIICVAAVLVVVLAVFGLRKWYFQPREVRAAEEMFAAEQWFAQGDYEKHSTVTTPSVVSLVSSTVTDALRLAN